MNWFCGKYKFIHLKFSKAENFSSRLHSETIPKTVVAEYPGVQHKNHLAKKEGERYFSEVVHRSASSLINRLVNLLWKEYKLINLPCYAFCRLI